MGFFGGIQRLAVKAGHSATRLGRKVQHEAHRLAVKVQPIAHKVASVAGQVGKVAGVVSKVATAALPFTAEIPIVGEVVGGVAAGSKALQLGARGVGKVAGMIDKSAGVVKAVTR